jgi:hypothetical protein
MGWDGPTLPLASTEARNFLNLPLFNSVLTDHRRQSNPIPIQTSSQNRQNILTVYSASFFNALPYLRFPFSRVSRNFFLRSSPCTGVTTKRFPSV